MELAGGAAAPSPNKASVATNLPPLDPDVKLIAAVLSALFNEPLKPVNAKAQRKVAVPAGLDLDVWIRPEEGASPECGPGSGRVPRVCTLAPTAPVPSRPAPRPPPPPDTTPAEAEFSREDKIRGSFKYESISFEDSYGVTDEEFAGKGSGEWRARAPPPRAYAPSTSLFGLSARALQRRRWATARAAASSRTTSAAGTTTTTSGSRRWNARTSAAVSHPHTCPLSRWVVARRGLRTLTPTPTPAHRVGR